GNLIQLQFGTAHNWPFGAAFSFGLLAFVLLAMLIYNLRFRANAGGGQPRTAAIHSGPSAACARPPGCSSPSSTSRSWCW
ncbi:hypothetical protein ACKUFK_26045, partial [Escherichia coli]